jgi:type 1 fimbriae regulatory protein FimB/type 1 fimbriae regulatory protein FimE
LQLKPLAKARIHVNRAKNGEPSTHPLSGVELRALRRLKRESIESPFVFVSEGGSPFTTDLGGLGNSPRRSDLE